MAHVFAVPRPSKNRIEPKRTTISDTRLVKYSAPIVPTSNSPKPKTTRARPEKSGVLGCCRKAAHRSRIKNKETNGISRPWE